MQNVAIIIPCYNEEARLCLKEFRDFLNHGDDRIHLFFVDDCSIDNTFEVINKLSSEYPERITGMRLNENLGKAGAVRKGFLKAFEDNFEAIGYWDADLATPLSEIHGILKVLESGSVEMVFGSRVRLMGRRVERRPLRHYLGRIFATVASLMLGLTVYDTQCGAKLFKNSTNLVKVFNKPFTVNWIFDIEIIARFILLSDIPMEEAVYEYPLQKWQDKPGSKLKMFDFFYASYELIKLGLWLHISK